MYEYSRLEMWNDGTQYDEPGDFDEDSRDITVGRGNAMQKVQISNNIQINVKVTPIIERTTGFSFNATVEEGTEKLMVTKTDDDTVAESITEKIKEIVTSVVPKEVEDETELGSGSSTAYIVVIVIAGLLIIIIICLWLRYR